MILLTLLAFMAGLVLIVLVVDAVTDPWEFFTRPRRNAYGAWAQ
jgi:hypothetical protein